MALPSVLRAPNPFLVVDPLIFYRRPPPPADTVEPPQSIQARLNHLAAALLIDEAAKRYGTEKPRDEIRRRRGRDAPMNDLAHLFGLPDAEHMQWDLATVVEQVMDDHCDVQPPPFNVEEWTTCPADSFLPSADRVLEWMCEHASEEMIDEYCSDAYDAASHAPDVVAAMEQVIVLLSSKVGYRMADDLVANHHVTFNDADEPLVDGEILFPTP